jgi:predicted dienelactone hydrolase
MTLLLPVVFFHKVLNISQQALWSGMKASLASCLLAGGMGLGDVATAAETITVHLGPISQTIELADLEHFAETGEARHSLRLYGPFLSSAVRHALVSDIELDPEISHVVLEEILNTSGGSQLLNTLQAVAPNLSAADLRAMIDRSVEVEPTLNLVDLLQAIPQETLEVNLEVLLSLASKFHLAQMESEALSHILSTELASHDQATRLVTNVDPFSAGPSQVERWELVLRDKDRDRSIPVDIYWSEDTRGPLVVISHGFGADRRFLAYLAQHLASHGLTVIAVEHPGSNVTALVSVPSEQEKSDQTANRILPATELLERPKDISFVLDRMEKLNYYSYHLRDRLNTEQVAFIGHSLGGYTGLALAGAPLDLEPLDQFCQQLSPVSFSPADWLQCAALDLPIEHVNLQDDRIAQLIVMNPLTGLLFGESGLTQVTVPTLVLAGTHDSVTPIAEQQLKPFEQLAGPKYLITVIGGSHLSIGDPDNLNSELSRIPFMPALPGLSTARLRSFLQGVSLSFIMQQTQEAEVYADVLSPAYAERFSTAALPLRLTQDLPDSVTNWPRLKHNHLHSQEQLSTYGPSLLHLEMVAIQNQFNSLQQQMVAYLRSTPPSLTAIYWTRPRLHAQTPKSSPAATNDQPAQ